MTVLALKILNICRLNTTSLVKKIQLVFIDKRYLPLCRAEYMESKYAVNEKVLITSHSLTRLKTVRANVLRGKSHVERQIKASGACQTLKSAQ